MPENQSAPESRGSNRLPPRDATHVEVFRAPDGLGPNLAAAVLDVSATGARLVLAEQLPPGHILGVALYSQRSFLPVACAATVVWSRDADGGGFVTGVRFDGAAGEENLSAVAGSPQ